MKVQNRVLLILLVFSPDVFTVSYGSYSAVARQGFVTFPMSDANNAISGYITFDSGFRLENSTTNCAFNAVCPVNGTIELSGGTLQLSKSFICQSGTALSTVGAIAGNNLSLMFSSTSPFMLPCGLVRGNVPYFVASSSVGASYYACSWTSDGNYIASGVPNNSILDLYVFSFDGSTLTRMASIQLNQPIYSIAWSPGGYYIAVARNRALELLYYDPVAQTLTTKQTINYSNNMAYAVAWSPDGNYVAAGTAVSGGQVVTYFFNRSTGTLTQAASYSIAATIKYNSICWDSSGNYIAIGTAAYTGPEVQVYSFDRTTSSLVLNASAEIGQAALEVHFHPSLPLLAVSASVGVASLFLFAFDAAAGTLTLIPSGEIDDSLAFQSIDWNAAGTQLAVGKNAGIGALSVFDFDATTSSFILNSQLYSSGSFFIVRWRPDGDYLGAGGTAARQDVYYTKLRKGLEIGNCKVTFDSDVSIQNIMTFTGTCFVEGNNNKISFGPYGGFVVDQGASVMLKDMTLVGITGTNVRCLDALSTISFSNAVLEFSGYTTFAQGHFDIVGDTVCTGTQVFAYQTPVTSTIGKNALLYFDSGMTLSYVPSTSSKILLQMADNSSCLELNDAQLYVSATGLQLTKGRLIIDGSCSFINDGADVNHGISFGDGISASNNLNTTIAAGSGIWGTRGFLVNNNV